MTISELITQLQKLKDLHGDLPVTRPQGYDMSYVEEVDSICKLEAVTNKKKDDHFPTPHIHLS